MAIVDLPTPSLLVERSAFDRTVATMAARWPGTRLRPHVKAFKPTALANRLAANGHTGFCCATICEIEGISAGEPPNRRNAWGPEGDHPPRMGHSGASQLTPSRTRSVVSFAGP